MGTIDSIFDGTDAHRIGEDAMREQFEAWIKRGSSLACFDLGEGGNYIVLGMQDMFEAFCAGAILAGSNAELCGSPKRSVGESERTPGYAAGGEER